jgi:hypothetical protein
VDGDLYIGEDSVLTNTGETHLSANILNEGTLNLESGNLMILPTIISWTGNGDGVSWIDDPANWQGVDLCNSETFSSGSVTFRSGAITTVSVPTIESNVCINNTITGNLIITSGTVGEYTSIPAITISSGGVVTEGNLIINSELTLIDNGSVTMAGDLVLTTLTKESLATFAGFEWLTSDGKTCTVTSEGDCITADGARYIVDDSGALVPEPVADGGAQLNLYLLLALFVLLPILRNQTARSKHFLHPKMLNAIK